MPYVDDQPVEHYCSMGRPTHGLVPTQNSDSVTKICPKFYHNDKFTCNQDNRIE